MADDAQRREHERLQKRTDELKQEHADLARDRTPFDQADHDAHTANLRKHHDELNKHKDTVADRDPGPGRRRAE